MSLGATPATFVPLGIAVLTVSDTRSARRRPLGRHARRAPRRRPATPRRPRHRHRRRRGDPGAVSALDRRSRRSTSIITTGGTGFTGRDVTPEALEPLFEKRMDGFSAVFHRISLRQDRHLDDPVARDRGRRRRDLHLRAARLARRLPGRLGRHPRRPARLPAPALQLRRDHAPARRAPAARRRSRAESATRAKLVGESRCPTRSSSRLTRSDAPETPTSTMPDPAGHGSAIFAPSTGFTSLPWIIFGARRIHSLRQLRCRLARRPQRIGFSIPATMTRQNRVLPTGEIVALPFRGTLTGNRGILHDAAGRLGVARWRHAELDRLRPRLQGAAAGRHDARDLDGTVLRRRGRGARGGPSPLRGMPPGRLRALPRGLVGRDRNAAERDRDGPGARMRPGSSPARRSQRRFGPAPADLPDGTFVLDGGPRTRARPRPGRMHAWSPDGYGPARAAPTDAIVLTPAPTVAVLAAGYRTCLRLA